MKTLVPSILLPIRRVNKGSEHLGLPVQRKSYGSERLGLAFIINPEVVGPAAYLREPSIFQKGLTKTVVVHSFFFWRGAAG